jgi:hypothetical protein
MSDEKQPSVNGPNGDPGRGPDGKFSRGNRHGRGNAVARRGAAYRVELFRAITPAKFREVITTMVTEAVAGEGWAVKEFLDRVLGKAMPMTEMIDREATSADLDEQIKHHIESIISRAREPLLARIAELESAAVGPSRNGEANGHYPTK